MLKKLIFELFDTPLDDIDTGEEHLNGQGVGNVTYRKTFTRDFGGDEYKAYITLKIYNGKAFLDVDFASNDSFIQTDNISNTLKVIPWVIKCALKTLNDFTNDYPEESNAPLKEFMFWFVPTLTNKEEDMEEKPTTAKRRQTSLFTSIINQYFGKFRKKTRGMTVVYLIDENTTVAKCIEKIKSLQNNR